MNTNIFREYDIRGIVDEDFPDEVVINLGRAYGKFLSDNNQKNISISGDIRYSTNRLKNNLIEENIIYNNANGLRIGTGPSGSSSEYPTKLSTVRKNLIIKNIVMQ